MKKQVEKNAYNFKKYCDIDRWNSYWHQIKEVLDLKPNSVLEIGIGDKVLGGYLKNNTGINYQSLDIAEDLQPDILGNVENLPFLRPSFDIVCAFEILEHLPFNKFNTTLKELHRVTNKYVIISLPRWGRYFSIELRLPGLKKIKWHYKANLFPIKHEFNGQHYWEIGKKKYPLKLIKKAIKQAGFGIVKDYVVFESPYHHFFILVKQ